MIAVELYSTVCGATASYSGGPGFKTRHRDQLPRQVLHGLLYFLQAHSRTVLYIKLGHAFFVSSPFQYFNNHTTLRRAET
jgi:hypothetical protein